MSGHLPTCSVLLHSWKPTRKEDAAEVGTLYKNPLLHTCGWVDTTLYTHHLSPSGLANCWSPGGERKPLRDICLISEEWGRRWSMQVSFRKSLRNYYCKTRPHVSK
jgi:hypothetical protein